MFVYSRKISFIDYYVNGVKSGNVGVVRQKVTDENIYFSIRLLGLEKWRNNRIEVGIGNSRERKKIFDLEIDRAGETKEYVLPLTKLEKGKSKKIIFELGNDCYGLADLCDLPDVKIQEAREEAALLKKDYAKAYEESKGESDTAELRDPESEELRTEALKTEDTKTEKEESRTEVLKTEDAKTENAGGEPEVAETIGEEPSYDEADELLAECMSPQPDKWEVIKKKYPILYPFKGQGPYVSIKPVDLKLLNNKYHHLSENSYLMHGFYRYRHMILGEYSQEKGTFFYVGVPGEFVKKEQSSAAVFGFEGYEHSGDLGYYLYRVEL